MEVEDVDDGKLTRRQDFEIVEEILGLVLPGVQEPRMQL